MKIALLLSVMIYVLFSCSKQNTTLSHTIIVSVLADSTDHMALYPEPEPLEELFHFTDNEDKAATFRFSTINDLQLNPIEVITIPESKITEQANTEDDPNYRSKVIITAYDSIGKMLRNFQKACNSLKTESHSECYRAIANEINRLSSSNADAKYLIVYSDLFENSSLFDIYTPTGDRMVKTNPKKIVSAFLTTIPLENTLNNIHVVFVYKPNNRVDDERFLAMVKVYRLLLEPRQAIVSIQAENNHFE